MNVRRALVGRGPRRRRGAWCLLVCLCWAAPADAGAQTVPGNATSLEARLRRLEDEAAIRRLLAAYIELVDSQDFARYADLFTADGELIFGENLLRGRTAIRARMEEGARSSQGSALVGASHLLTDVDLDLRGDEATARARWTLLTRGADGRPVVSAAGHYRDLLVRESGGWRFERRVVYADIPRQDPFETTAVQQALPHAYPREGARLLIDNERVAVWEVTLEKGRPTPMHRHRHDLVGVDLADATSRVIDPDGTVRSGAARVGQVLSLPAGVIHVEEGTSDTPRRAIVVDLKDGGTPPLANASGFPDAFPREGATKVLETDRVTVWDYTWTLGRPTPMHFHGKDTVTVFLADGELRSIAPDGGSTSNPVTFGSVRFRPRDRTHVEELVAGGARVIAFELK